MDLAPLDMALFGVVALIVGIGLFRGLSGELASFAGFVAAAVAGYCLYGWAHECVRSMGFNKGDMTELAAAGVADFVLGLVVFGFVRKLVCKFVSFLVPQPTNALLGALSGAFKSGVLLLLLAGVGFMQPGTYAQGPIAARSQIVGTIATWADSFYADCQEQKSGDDR